MTDRSPESMLHELDYWRALIADVTAINELIAEATEPLTSVTVETIALVLGGDKVTASERIHALVMRSMQSLLRMDEPLNRMLSLIEGRQLALQAEKVA